MQVRISNSHGLRDHDRHGPEPNGMNSKDFPQKSTRSATSTSRNLSGTNSSGLSHADGSRMIAHALKMTVDPFGTA